MMQTLAFELTSRTSIRGRDRLDLEPRSMAGSSSGSPRNWPA